MIEATVTVSKAGNLHGLYRGIVGDNVEDVLRQVAVLEPSGSVLRAFVGPGYAGASGWFRSVRRAGQLRLRRIR